MLSDEEKKVIEYFKRRIANKKTAYTSIYFKIEKLDALINLIDKQQKEIEELKEDNKHQWEERCKLTFELENSTSKDKIKAQLDIIEKYIKQMKED